MNITMAMVVSVWWIFLPVLDEATVVSVNMFVRDFIEINDLKMVISKQVQRDRSLIRNAI